ncbi:response regulator [Candidatus Woesebacteria bacterium]|nr:response regulator [Candidatus Woesebacteria bacterium]
MDKEKKKIIFIEDDPVLSKMYKIKLEDAGYEVLIAENGKIGLEEILKGDVDLILLDIMMPQLSGMDMLSKLRENESYQDLPVLIITNLTSDKDRQRAKELDVAEYLMKADLTPTQLLDKVNGILVRG